MVKEINLTYKTDKGEIRFKEIPLFQYQENLEGSLKSGLIDFEKCVDMLEQMLMIRAFEEMIVELSFGIYKPLKKANYIGPTHLSIGQEATSVGSISALVPDDNITSTHRGHGDAISKGYNVIKSLDKKSLIDYLVFNEKALKSIGEDFSESDEKKKLQELAIRIHLFRMLSELFGKESGYCRGVGGAMHIADFKSGHLGANAIVGGHMGIAVGAAAACRFKKNKNLVLCLAGDGAYSNGIAHESMNFATMLQFKNGIMGDKFGIPIIFGVINNGYAMSGQEYGEITGIDFIARRAAAYDIDLMHAEVVDGMDVLCVYESTLRAAQKIREGKGPVLLEYMNYRYKGHSLSDAQKYREKSEVEQWKQYDPIKQFIQLLTDKSLKDKNLSPEKILEIEKKIYERNAEMAIKAYHSQSPLPETLLDFVYYKQNIETVSSGTFSSPGLEKDAATIECSYRDAIREGITEEMKKDERVILFGEDVADYGGAFGVTKGLLEEFGRERIFNTSISESAIIGAGIGMSMMGLRPITEIMYGDFILQAMDQIGNQAAKWCYMSGGQIFLPMVIRTTIGGGKGYAGQHSQSLEGIVTHFPGLIVVCPSCPMDAKGLIKAAIQEPNPVVFFEHQLLYNIKGQVPQTEYMIPLGQADIKKQGSDITLISYSYMLNETLSAAHALEEKGISAEVIDLRTLIPFDKKTVIESIKKTNKAAIISQEVIESGYCAEVASTIYEEAFDYLDMPVVRIAAPRGIPPSAPNLEKLFLPNAEAIEKKIYSLIHDHS